MKTQEEIERLAFLEYPRLINDPYRPMEDDNADERQIWIGAYTQCQEDLMAGIYSKIENLIITWSIDGTQTAGTLTRQIIKLLNPNEND